MRFLCTPKTVLLLLACAVLWPGPVRGEESPAPSPVVVESNPGNAIDDARFARRSHPHAIYVELFGKGGLYTLGYDYAFTDRLAVGAGGSYLPVEGERVFTLAPYLNVYPAVGPWGSFLAQAGLEIVHIAVPSEVPGWSGTSSSGVAGQISLGYEYRHGILIRVLLTGVLGKGGFRPWAGIGLGGAI
jgi:hypothetical protein